MKYQFSLISVLALFSTVTFAIEPSKELGKVLNIDERSGIEFIAHQDKKIGKLSTSFLANDSIYELSLSGDLDQDDNQGGTFSGDKGINAGSEFEFSFTHFFKKDAGPVFQNYDEELRAAEDAFEVVRNALTKCKEDETKAGKTATQIATICEKQQTAFNAKPAPIVVDKKLNILNKLKYFDLSVAYNRTSFKHFSLTSNDTIAQTEGGYKVGISGGRINAGKASRIEAGVDFREGFEAGAKPINFCRDLPANSAFTECLNLSIVPPEEKQAIISSVTYSKMFDETRIVKAISVKAYYVDKETTKKDTPVVRSHTYGAEIPVYLFRSEDRKYSGGLLFDWTSDPAADADRTTLSAFFKTSLDVFALK